MEKTKAFRYPLLMAALTLFTIWKIRLGLYHDEVQLINLGKLLVEGDSFVQFTGMGMSHYLLWPLMALFHRVVGSYDGVFLFLRYWFVLFQLAVSLYTYTTLKLFWSERQAAAASVLSVLFVFNFYAITYKATLFWGTMLTVLFLLRCEKTKKTRYLVFSALALSADVLGYPPFTALLLIPVTRLLLKDRPTARRTIAIYWGTCALCALAFLIPILARYPVSQIMEAYFDRDIYKTAGVVPSIKKTAAVLAMLLAAELGIRLGKRCGFFTAQGKKQWAGLSVVLWCVLLGIVLVKPETASASRFWYVFLGFYVLAVSLRRHGLLRVSHGQLVDILFFEVSAWTILAIALISDQGVAIIAYGSVFGLIGACIALLDENNDGVGKPQMLAWSLVLAMLICSAVFVSDQNARVESAHIFQSRERLGEGPGKGLYVAAYTERVYAPYAQAARNAAVPGDRLFIISGLAQPYGTMAADVTEAIPSGYIIKSFLNTSKGENYCAAFPERSPTVVLVDTAYTGDYETWREKTVFARYLDEHFRQASQSEDGRWIVLRRNPES
ncbi:MAG: glycosyltransferase family 39 protein [Oscillospiraceae bacterium]|nr:glycosyltransferase family 39 protein [Oscillospiraceae bacterium]